MKKAPYKKEVQKLQESLSKQGYDSLVVVTTSKDNEDGFSPTGVSGSRATPARALHMAFHMLAVVLKETDYPLDKILETLESYYIEDEK